jgi:hypothetical protein
MPTFQFRYPFAGFVHVKPNNFPGDACESILPKLQWHEYFSPLTSDHAGKEKDAGVRR